MANLAINLGQDISQPFGKFGVSKKHVYGKGNFVGDALTWTMTAAEKLKIGNIVKSAITVFVMNGLIRRKRAAKVLFHNVAMFKHFSLFAGIGSKGGNGQTDVSVALNVSANFSSGKFSRRLSHLPLNLAFMAAKFLLVIVFGPAIISNISAARLNLAALNTGEYFDRLGRFVLGFAPTFGRAVHWVFAPFFSVGRHIGRFYAKFSATFGADEFNLSDPGSSSTVGSFVCLPARWLTVSSTVGFGRLYGESGAAVFAGLFHSVGDSKGFAVAAHYLNNGGM